MQRVAAARYEDRKTNSLQLVDISNKEIDTDAIQIQHQSSLTTDRTHYEVLFHMVIDITEGARREWRASGEDDTQGGQVMSLYWTYTFLFLHCEPLGTGPKHCHSWSRSYSVILPCFLTLIG